MIVLFYPNKYQPWGKFKSWEKKLPVIPIQTVYIKNCKPKLVFKINLVFLVSVIFFMRLLLSLLTKIYFQIKEIGNCYTLLHMDRDCCFTQHVQYWLTFTSICTQQGSRLVNQQISFLRKRLFIIIIGHSLIISYLFI